MSKLLGFEIDEVKVTSQASVFKVYEIRKVGWFCSNRVLLAVRESEEEAKDYVRRMAKYPYVTTRTRYDARGREEIFTW